MIRPKRNHLGSLFVMMTAALAIAFAGSVDIYAAGQEAAGKGGTFAKEFLPTWQRAKTSTLEFAEAMPEEHYNFKPTPEIMSFGEQIVHAAGGSRSD